MRCTANYTRPTRRGSRRDRPQWIYTPSESDVRVRPPSPTSESDVRVRPPSPTSGSDVRVRRPCPTSESNLRVRCPSPTSESDVRVRPPSPTSESDLRIRPPNPTSESEIRVPPSPTSESDVRVQPPSPTSESPPAKCSEESLRIRVQLPLIDSVGNLRPLDGQSGERSVATRDGRDADRHPRSSGGFSP
jgi:hypothetical protein